MRLSAIILLVLLVFAGSLAGFMYMAGGFTKEGLQKLLGVEPVQTAEATPPASTEQIPELLKAIKEREAELDEREAVLKAEEARVNEQRAQLVELRTTLSALVAEATKTMDEAEASKRQQLQNVALSLSAMEPENAADAIGSWAPEDAAIVLQLIEEERQRGAILDSLEPDQAASVLRAMQEVAPPPAPAPVEQGG